jgi:hypothetical protein
LKPLNYTEQSIYNTYLKILRADQPYQPRKNFNNLPLEVKVNLNKLNNFFNKFPHISQEDFFKAPLELHPTEKLPPLKFYTTRPAIRLYTLYHKQLQNQTPDKQLDKIKQGLHFIAKFCLHHKIPLEKYNSFKIGAMPAWMQHYREHQVNIYSLMEIIDFNDLKKQNLDETSFWCPDLLNNINAYKTRYYNSPKTQQLVKEGTNKIKNFIKQELTNINSSLILKQTNNI